MTEELEYRDKVVSALTRIETKLDDHVLSNKTDFDRISVDLRTCITDIPTIKTNLDNHLKHHDKFQRYFIYPVAVGLAVALAKTVGLTNILWKIILEILHK